MSKFILVNSFETSARIRINVDHIVKYYARDDMNGSGMELTNEVLLLKESIGELDQLLRHNELFNESFGMTK